MSISREDVERVARLARIDLDAGEAERMAGELDRILAFAERLPTLGPGEGGPEEAGPFRVDRVETGLSPAEALASAPERAGDLFRVPPAIDRG